MWDAPSALMVSLISGAFHMLGTLVQLGRGKFDEVELKRMLAAKDRRVAGMTAPAHGLVLWKVFYNSNRRSRRKEALTQPSRLDDEE